MSTKPAYVKLGRYLAWARVSAGLTQTQLAKRLGRTQSFVATIETGRRRIDVVEFAALAKALDVPAARLFARVVDQL